VHLVRHASSQLAIAVQAGPRREVQLAVAVRGEQRIRTQLTQLTIPVVQGRVLVRRMISRSAVYRI
jgi:hypothetical protein